MTKNLILFFYSCFFHQQQFSGIKTNWHEFMANVTIGAIIGFLTIFAKIASAIIMWKLIISGHSYALGLIGLDGRHNDIISNSMEQTLNKRANIV